MLHNNQELHYYGKFLPCLRTLKLTMIVHTLDNLIQLNYGYKQKIQKKACIINSNYQEFYITKLNQKLVTEYCRLSIQKSKYYFILKNLVQKMVVKIFQVLITIPQNVTQYLVQNMFCQILLCHYYLLIVFLFVNTQSEQKLKCKHNLQYLIQSTQFFISHLFDFYFQIFNFVRQIKINFLRFLMFFQGITRGGSIKILVGLILSTQKFWL
eukprot:TRINITY_DN6372_c1_g1_i1.p1 TRINITY_DN6372_c1_g1~~TRINITY_DN6372_c1_g1_i1.p1  ORF type:complete len:211 (+),score=-21.14 TRINITY_DN6372_c1_g1_i1:819-1451(+)